jgi:hypothetical protein
MAPVFLNKSCDPFTPADDQCIIGAYVLYSVDVASPDHVIKTLAFAKEHNIRFVVKNTGHECVFQISFVCGTFLTIENQLHG